MMIMYRYRVKSKVGCLNKQANSVNIVWNYCNSIQKKAVKTRRQWLSAVDLCSLTSGSNVYVNLHSQTIQGICQQYCKNRSQQKKPFLKYRNGKKLGWVPIKAQSIQFVNNSFKFQGTIYNVFYHRPLPIGFKIRDGSSFSQDTKNHWYLNLVIEIPNANKKPLHNVIGIDLGLKDFATLSDGTKIEAPRIYRKYEDKYGMFQRAKKKKQARNIAIKIKNARKDFHQKLSTKLIKGFDGIAVGNVSAYRLARTNMAKSVLDAGWSSFKNMLCYKAVRHGVTFLEVEEAYSTQTCSSCGFVCGPKGLTGLGIRNWQCGSCGVLHDRDVNSAINILANSRLGHQAPAEGAGNLNGY